MSYRDWRNADPDWQTDEFNRPISLWIPCEHERIDRHVLEAGFGEPCLGGRPATLVDDQAAIDSINKIVDDFSTGDTQAPAILQQLKDDGFALVAEADHTEGTP